MIWNQFTASQEITLILAVFACILWISEFIPLYATSFLLLFLELSWLLPELKTTNPKMNAEVFLSPFFSDTILLFLGGFVISASANKYGLDLRLAKYFLGTRSYSNLGLLISIVTITSFISMWMNNTATASLMIGLVLPIAKSFSNLSHQKGILLAVPFASNIGGIGTPVGTLPNAIAMEFLRGKGIIISFLDWMIYAVPLVFLLNLILIGIIYWFFFKKEGNQTESKSFILFESDPRPSFSKLDFTILSIIILTIVLWLTSDFHKLSNGTIAIIPVVVFFSSKILNSTDFRNLSWDVLILMGGGISLGKCIEISGLGVALLSSFIIQDYAIYVVILIFTFATLCLSAVMSNTSVANLMIPIALALGVYFTDSLVVMVAISASLSMPLPISTPPNAILLAYGIINSREMLKPGLWMTLTAWALLVSFGYYWMKLCHLGHL